MMELYYLTIKLELAVRSAHILSFTNILSASGHKSALSFDQ